MILLLNLNNDAQTLVFGLLERKRQFRLQRIWNSLLPVFRKWAGNNFSSYLNQTIKEAQTLFQNLSNIFCPVFDEKFQSSELKVRIMLGQWQQIDDWSQKLNLLFKCLQSIKKISLKIWQNGFLNYIPDQVVSFVRSVLFGGLTAFTTIKELQLEHIQFEPSASPTHLQAIEYILQDLFQNNIVTHLKISYCHNFPVFPCISTLQKISLKGTTFWKQYGFMNNLTHNNKSIKQIVGSYLLEQWTISRQLFSQLQTLIVQNSTKIFLQNDLPNSKIRYLSVGYSNIGSVNNLLKVLPKLSNLTSLKLFKFNHQLLSIIPSPHLEELGMKYNNQLTNKDLMNIDLKWPNLRQLSLYSCENVTEEAWQLCELRGLKMLRIDHRMLREGGSALHHLARRGIRVCY